MSGHCLTCGHDLCQCSEIGVCTTFTHRAVPINPNPERDVLADVEAWVPKRDTIDGQADFVAMGGEWLRALVARCREAEAEIVDINVELAHRNTHVTCEMERDRLMAENERLTGERDAALVQRQQAEAQRETCRHNWLAGLNSVERAWAETDRLREIIAGRDVRIVDLLVEVERLKALNTSRDVMTMLWGWNQIGALTEDDVIARYKAEREKETIK